MLNFSKSGVERGGLKKQYTYVRNPLYFFKKSSAAMNTGVLIFNFTHYFMNDLSSLLEIICGN